MCLLRFWYVAFFHLLFFIFLVLWPRFQFRRRVVFFRRTHLLFLPVIAPIICTLWPHRWTILWKRRGVPRLGWCCGLSSCGRSGCCRRRPVVRAVVGVDIIVVVVVIVVPPVVEGGLATTSANSSTANASTGSSTDASASSTAAGRGRHRHPDRVVQLVLDLGGRARRRLGRLPGLVEEAAPHGISSYTG